MFKFLKDKLKNAVDKFTKKAEEEAEEIKETSEEKEINKGHQYSDAKIQEPREEKNLAGQKEKAKEKTPEEKIHENIEESHEDIEIIHEDIKESPEEKDINEKKSGFFGKIFHKKQKPGEYAHEKDIGEKDSVKENQEEKTGFFKKISDTVTKVSLNEKKFDELFWELELSLLENNVAVEAIEKIKQDLKNSLVNKKMPRKELGRAVVNSLKASIEGLLDNDKIDLVKEASKKKPYIIALIGINGTGKTTTLAKLVKLFKDNGLEPVVAACDTFRAAAIQQLEEHTIKLKAKLIKHDYGSDAAAVAYDAIEHAKSKKRDVVLIDTAGRLHSNKNLMQELEKILRVAKPDLKIFVGESIAGNDVVEQAKYFQDKIGIDAIILSKADTDEKGGAAISVSYVTGKPILYLGTGQDYDDLEEFDKSKIMSRIGLG